MRGCDVVLPLRHAGFAQCREVAQRLRVAVRVDIPGDVLPVGAASFRILFNSQYVRCPVLPMYDPTIVHVAELEDWTLTAIRTRHHVSILQNGKWKTLCPLFFKNSEE